MKIDIIAGARPNFIKVSAIIDAIKSHPSSNIKYRFVHTGQHYDTNMSEKFFEQLNIPFPDENLGVGSGSQTEQTAKIMLAYEKLLIKEIVDYCLVVGDVTSTLACSLVAKKLGIKILHVEAGIRSGDISMPEEINRIVTDSITDYFFTTSKYADENLLKSGVNRERIFFVGNTMIDTLVKNLGRINKPNLWNKYKLSRSNYLLLTLHRPNNVDDPENLYKILNYLAINSRGCPVIFPVHPRTKKTMDLVENDFKNLHLVNPLGYLEFIYLLKYSKAVITDSGGITEEATYLGIPCLTLRDSTERPETCSVGTNKLVSTDPSRLKPALEMVFQKKWKKGQIPELWDGQAAKRIVGILSALESN